MNNREKEAKAAFEKIMERLQKSGALDGWNKPGRPGGQINLSQMKSLQKTAKALEQLEQLLQKEVQKDREKIDELKEKVERLKHGGGL